jgi:hypothetical protein
MLHQPLKFVHQPIVRYPAHPRRLVGLLVIGQITAEPQAQITSAPQGPVIDSLSMGGVGESINPPKSDGRRAAMGPRTEASSFGGSMP